MNYFPFLLGMLFGSIGYTFIVATIDMARGRMPRLCGVVVTAAIALVMLGIVFYDISQRMP